MQSFQTIGLGTIPIVLHLPHNSTYIPDDFDWNLDQHTLYQEIHRLVDHHTLELFSTSHRRRCHNSAGPVGYILTRNALQTEKRRRWIKLGWGCLYPYDRRREVREDDLDTDYECKLERLYHPYHQQFTQIVDDMLSRFGRVLIDDGHSYPKHPLPYGNLELRPQIDIGTWTEPDRHTPQVLIEHTSKFFRERGYSVDLDTPFKGSIIPTKFIGDTRVQTMMLEIRRDVYLCSDSYAKGDVHLDLNKLRHFHRGVERWLSWKVGR